VHVHSGPPARSTLAGLYDAKLDRRPVVAIVGQVMSTALGSGYLQEVDLDTLFKDVCSQYVQTVFAPEQALMALDNAMRAALATSTPTCLIVPHDGADRHGQSSRRPSPSPCP
jgi:pyruvate dehydrogenase (quinone)